MSTLARGDRAFAQWRRGTNVVRAMLVAPPRQGLPDIACPRVTTAGTPLQACREFALKEGDESGKRQTIARAARRRFCSR